MFGKRGEVNQIWQWSSANLINRILYWLYWSIWLFWSYIDCSIVWIQYRLFDQAHLLWSCINYSIWFFPVWLTPLLIPYWLFRICLKIRWAVDFKLVDLGTVAAIEAQLPNCAAGFEYISRLAKTFYSAFPKTIQFKSNKHIFLSTWTFIQLSSKILDCQLLESSKFPWFFLLQFDIKLTDKPSCLVRFCFVKGFRLSIKKGQSLMFSCDLKYIWLLLFYHPVYWCKHTWKKRTMLV